MKKRLGFTLAEVLITLGIIGVVAAMTIPTLMNQTGQAEFKTGLKKMVSALNQAVTMNVALDSVSFADVTTTAAATTTDPLSLYYLFSNRMNVISTGSATDVISGANDATNYTLFLNDGAAISWLKTAGGCTTTAQCNILVDVNGKKRPNVYTTASTDVKDQFGIKIYGQQALPNAVGRDIMWAK